jgi:hypothetical protein
LQPGDKKAVHLMDAQGKAARLLSQRHSITHIPVVILIGLAARAARPGQAPSNSELR